MTREEFDKLYLGKAVHCDTEEKANEFLALADSVGYKWKSGKSLIEINNWETYKEVTCYDIEDGGFMFSGTTYFELDGYPIIEYEPQSKFKVGDKVRVKDALYGVDGKVGVITEKRNSLITSLSLYLVEINNDGSIGNWCFYENELEKVEEPTHEEETIDDIIEEIEHYQRVINILHDRLKRKAKAGK